MPTILLLPPKIFRHSYGPMTSRQAVVGGDFCINSSVAWAHIPCKQFGHIGVELFYHLYSFHKVDFFLFHTFHALDNEVSNMLWHLFTKRKDESWQPVLKKHALTVDKQWTWELHFNFKLGGKQCTQRANSKPVESKKKSNGGMEQSSYFQRIVLKFFR